MGSRLVNRMRKRNRANNEKAKLAICDETTHGFVVEPGAFDIMVGASPADVRLKDRIEVTR
jgi:hypothetical protein